MGIREDRMLANLSPEKKAMAEALLSQPVLARIATANLRTGQPHLVPLWFLWDGESIWISGFRSTRKFRELLENPKCAVLVEPADPKASKIQAVLFEGAAEVVMAPRQLVEEMSTRIYLRYLGEEGVKAADPQSWIHDAENLVVRLTPQRVFTW
jgi:nitroimidazol reductase NimA-like FMN-containing flavoprotein (pyridoxamine 5'-phosphate oxidase superfamily)